jgi:predicted DNA-binding protein
MVVILSEATLAYTIAGEFTNLCLVTVLMPTGTSIDLDRPSVTNSSKAGFRIFGMFDVVAREGVRIMRDGILCRFVVTQETLTDDDNDNNELLNHERKFFYLDKERVMCYSEQTITPDGNVQLTKHNRDGNVERICLYDGKNSKRLLTTEIRYKLNSNVVREIVEKTVDDMQTVMVHKDAMNRVTKKVAKRIVKKMKDDDVALLPTEQLSKTSIYNSETTPVYEQIVFANGKKINCWYDENGNMMKKCRVRCDGVVTSLKTHRRKTRKSVWKQSQSSWTTYGSTTETAIKKVTECHDVIRVSTSTQKCAGERCECCSKRVV